MDYSGAYPGERRFLTWGYKSRGPAFWLAWAAVFVLLGSGLVFYTLQGGSSDQSAPSVFETPTLNPPAVTATSPNNLLVPTAPQPLSALTPRLEITSQPVEPGSLQPYWRAGFSISRPATPALWALRLGAGWYVDWQAGESYGEYPEYWRMVRTTSQGFDPPLAELQALVEEHPGQVWVIGNEPDVIWQDNLSPEDYARAYGQLYDTIKSVDPTALVATGGISQATPLRFQYLERVLQEYQNIYASPMPVDWWTVHGYVLREEHNSWGVEIPPGIQAEGGILYEISDHGRIDYFEKQLRDFRVWMAGNGYQNTPLALTEFGILMPSEYGYPPEVVAEYLRETFHLLETLRDESTGYPSDDYRLVQRWAWYSLASSTFAVANLANLETGMLTPAGDAFREFTMSVMAP